MHCQFHHFFTAKRYYLLIITLLYLHMFEIGVY